MNTIKLMNKLNFDQYLEIANLVKHQLTTDRELIVHFDYQGDYGNYDIKIDKDNNIVVRLLK